MKKTLKFLLIKKRPDMPWRHGYPQPIVFERIAARFPEIVNDLRTSVEVVLEENDSKLVEIMRFLQHESGLRPLLTESESLKARHDDDRTFVVKTSYKFDEQDVKNAEFLIMSTDVEVGLDGRDGKDWDQ